MSSSSHSIASLRPAPLEQATLPYRPLGNFVRRFAHGKLGFKVDALPMHQGTPFANILLMVARLPATAAP